MQSQEFAGGFAGGLLLFSENVTPSLRSGQALWTHRWYWWWKNSYNRSPSMARTDKRFFTAPGL